MISKSKQTSIRITSLALALRLVGLEERNAVAIRRACRTPGCRALRNPAQVIAPWDDIRAQLGDRVHDDVFAPEVLLELLAAARGHDALLLHVRADAQRDRHTEEVKALIPVLQNQQGAGLSSYRTPVIERCPLV